MVCNIDEMFDLDSALTMPDSMVVDGGAAAELLTVEVSDSGQCCTVCMEGFHFQGGGEAKQLPCSHAFHGNCISHWLSMHNSCPLCRRKID
ncbi:hypothetical protein ACS0TY_021581 [Phlomoides rotata]